MLTLGSDGEHLIGLWLEGQKYFGGAVREVLESLEQRTVHTSGLAHLLELPEYRSLERAQPLMSYLSEDADLPASPFPRTIP